MRNEDQNIEYKEAWRDEYLKWICGFANAQGGRIYIGIDDDRNIIGLSDSKRLMEDIPNKVVNSLGIVVDVNLLKKDNLEYIEIVVASSNMPIAYKGTYHYRSGSTKQELKGIALQQFIMNKMGRSWDDIPLEHATIADIDRYAIDYFLRCGINAGRVAEDERDSSTEEVLNNLGLMTPEGKLKTAAILLFGKHVRQFFPASEFKIGRFHTSESDLITQDLIECNIIQMAGKVIETLRSKYLNSPIRYEGMQRIEELEIPEKALREIIYNAIAHKDYTGPSIQMRIYDENVEIWNYGLLPTELSPEALMRKHASYPRNKNIAYTFFKAGFIESWGRGYKKIREELDRVGMPMPVIQEVDGGVMATFKRFTIEEIIAKRETERRNFGGNLAETWRKLGGNLAGSELTKRQYSICQLINENPNTTVQTLAESIQVSKRTIERELAKLQKAGIIRHEGKVNAGIWVILEPQKG